jgi:parallel beta helix pectate lyase-like protein
VLSLLILASLSLVRPTAQTIVTVRQSGPADFVGNDHATLARALERLEDGGTLRIGPGRYVLRRTLFLPAGLTIEGEAGTVLALPSPGVLREPAAAGARTLVLEGAGEFATDGRIAIHPPAGAEFLADGETRGLGPLALSEVRGARLELAEPLALDVPAGSRVSYPIKLLWVHREGRLTLENLDFDGGRVAEIPLMGHFMHCAIWASPPFGFGPERLGPPARELHVRHCRFTDWYGRALALYHVADSTVEGCLFERIADEAIDLDHYCERVRVSGNVVRDALWGVVLNDASRCLVEYNSIEDCEIGIHNWWFDKVPQGGINEENVIRHNFVRRARKAPIWIDRTCHRNVVEQNFVEGEIVVVEPSNRVEANSRP